MGLIDKCQNAKSKQSIFYPKYAKFMENFETYNIFIGYCFGSIFKRNHFNEFYENQQKILKPTPSFLGKTLKKGF